MGRISAVYAFASKNATTLVIPAGVLAVLGGIALAAQDRYTLNPG